MLNTVMQKVTGRAPERVRADRLGAALRTAEEKARALASETDALRGKRREAITAGEDPSAVSRRIAASDQEARNLAEELAELGKAVAEAEAEAEAARKAVRVAELEKEALAAVAEADSRAVEIEDALFVVSRLLANREAAVRHFRKAATESASLGTPIPARAFEAVFPKRMEENLRRRALHDAGHVPGATNVAVSVEELAVPFVVPPREAA